MADWEEQFKTTFGENATLPDDITWKDFFEQTRMEQAKMARAVQFEWALTNRFMKLVDNFICNAETDTKLQGIILCVAAKLKRTEIIDKIIQINKDSVQIWSEDEIIINNLDYWQTVGNCTKNWQAKFIKPNPLHIATYLNDFDLVEKLISACSPKNKLNFISKRFSTIHFETEEKPGEKYLKESFDTGNSLHIAIVKNHEKIFNFLVDTIMNCEDNLNKKVRALESNCKEYIWYYRAEPYNSCYSCNSLHIAALWDRWDMYNVLTNAQCSEDKVAKNFIKNDEYFGSITARNLSARR